MVLCVEGAMCEWYWSSCGCGGMCEADSNRLPLVSESALCPSEYLQQDPLHAWGSGEGEGTWVGYHSGR